MPIPSSHMKERLSLAYVSAVTAKAGVKLFGVQEREYGIDGYMQAVKKLPNGKFAESGPILQFQIKATTTCNLRNESVIYEMDIDAYNKLVTMDSGPCILILYRMPKNVDQWLNVNEETLLLSHCCYWAYITDPPSENKSSYTISIPRSQIFTPESVNDLLDKVKQGYHDGRST